MSKSGRRPDASCPNAKMWPEIRDQCRNQMLKSNHASCLNAKTKPETDRNVAISKGWNATRRSLSQSQNEARDRAQCWNQIWKATRRFLSQCQNVARDRAQCRNRPTHPSATTCCGIFHSPQIPLPEIWLDWTRTADERSIVKVARSSKVWAEVLCTFIVATQSKGQKQVLLYDFFFQKGKDIS